MSRILKERVDLCILRELETVGCILNLGLMSCKVTHSLKVIICNDYKINPISSI